MTASDLVQPVIDALAALDLTLLSEDDLRRMDQIARNLVTALTLEWFRRDREGAPPQPDLARRKCKDRPAALPVPAVQPKAAGPR